MGEPPTPPSSPQPSLTLTGVAVNTGDSQETTPETNYWAPEGQEGGGMQPTDNEMETRSLPGVRFTLWAISNRSVDRK